MDILSKIIAQKKIEVASRAQRISLDNIKKQCATFSKSASFCGQLKDSGFPAIIAEIKKASPSKGVLRADLIPIKAAEDYIRGGACCISVLTDEKFFNGKLEYLIEIKKTFPQIPLLRKDFIIHPYQIWESKLAGADCILLIVAAVEKADLRFLINEALEANLDILVEVHDQEECRIALEVINLLKEDDIENKVILGINNRDLRTFQTSLEITKDLVNLGASLSKEMKYNLDNLLVVSESGINSHADLLTLASYGAKAFLVGEILVKSGCLEDNLKKLIHGK